MGAIIGQVMPNRFSISPLVQRTYMSITAHGEVPATATFLVYLGQIKRILLTSTGALKKLDAEDLRIAVGIAGAIIARAHNRTALRARLIIKDSTMFTNGPVVRRHHEHGQSCSTFTAIFMPDIQVSPADLYIICRKRTLVFFSSAGGRGAAGWTSRVRQPIDR
jgi:hypothetical protein